MGAPHRTIVLALLTVVSLLVSACGGAPVQTGGASNGATPSAAGSASQAAVVGPFVPDATPGNVSTDPLVAAASQELSDRAAFRTGADMAGYLGPDAPALAAAMDRQSSDLLWKLVDAPTAGTDGALLVAFHVPHTGQPIPGTAGAPPPGLSLIGPLVTAIMVVEKSLGTDKAYSNPDHSTSEVALGPNKGTITTDSSITVTPTGSRLVVDVELKTSGEVVDANGGLVFRVNGTGHARIEVQACPDAQGTAPAAMEFSASEDYFVGAEGGRVGQSWQADNTADVKIFADDAANLDHSVLDMKGDRAFKGGSKAAGAGQSTLRAYSVGVTETMTVDPAGNGSWSNGRVTSADGATRADANSTFHSVEQLLGGAVYLAAKAAENFWRSGKCVACSASPNGGDVTKDSVTSVTVTVKQKFEGTELDKPVEAVSFSGVKSIDPAAGQKQPAPATFRYTAGSTDGDKGAVTFKSVSNRGIGQTSVQFVVGGPTTLRGSADMKTDFKNGPLRQTSQSHASDVVWQLDPNSRMRPANSDPADKISVFTIVSGQLAWSYEGIEQGSFTDTCPVRDSGTATLGANSDQQQAYLFIDWTKQPATYSFQGAVTGLGETTCLDVGRGVMDPVWASSDPNKDPTVSGTDAAFVLEGTYHLEGSYAGGTISTTYSWSFSSEP